MYIIFLFIKGWIDDVNIFDRLRGDFNWHIKKNKLIISSMVSVTNPPNTFHVDIFKRSLIKKDEHTLIYTTLGKKVQTKETKIFHSDYSWSCFLSKSN